MPKNLDELGLKSIANGYDIFFIDIWGVLHNGINLYQSSIEVLNQIEKLNKKYVLLTNAPRPNKTVIEFLKRMGLDENKCSKVYTSGESALKYLENNYKGKKVAFCADLIPSMSHLKLPYIPSYDIRPLVTMREKSIFLEKAVKDNYVLFFEHDAYNECCTLKLGEKGTRVNTTFRLSDL